MISSEKIKTFLIFHEGSIAALRHFGGGESSRKFMYIN